MPLVAVRGPGSTCAEPPFDSGESATRRAPNPRCNPPSADDATPGDHPRRADGNRVGGDLRTEPHAHGAAAALNAHGDAAALNAHGAVAELNINRYATALNAHRYAAAPNAHCYAIAPDPNAYPNPTRCAECRCAHHRTKPMAPDLAWVALLLCWGVLAALRWR